MYEKAAPSRYSATAICIHWTSAALLIAGYVLGENMARHSATALSYSLHVSFGMALLALTVSRIAMRFLSPPPPAPEGMPRWQALAASIIKAAFYVLMIMIPLTGWIAHSVEFGANGESTLIFGILPVWSLDLGLSRNFGHDLKELHEAAGQLWIPLMVLHALAALKHHFIDRDDVLVRILPVRSTG